MRARALWEAEEKAIGPTHRQQEWKTKGFSEQANILGW